MNNSLTRWFRRMTTPSPVRRRMRPSVELLEDRTVPAVFEVTTLADTVDADPAVTSLREAITAANDLDGDDSIRFAADLGGTINLDTVLPDLSSNVVVWGPGAGVLTVRRSDAAAEFRIFKVLAGATVVLSGLTITGGSVPGESIGGSNPPNTGGGIHTSGTLTMSNTTVSGNTAADGGGIFNRGTLTLTGSTISGNLARNEGGGIHTSENSALTVSHCTISGNSAKLGGGILSASNTTLTVDNSAVLGNTALNWGGGIFNDHTMTLSDSIVSGNSAGGRDEFGGSGTGAGGGIASTGPATLFNCTISDNLAAGVDGRGGGIVSGDLLTLINCTVSGNSALGTTDFGYPNVVGFGGGIHSLDQTRLTNTTISGNFASIHGGGLYHGFGTATLTNVTVTANRADGNDDGVSVGGGVSVEGGDWPGALYLHNTLVAGNFRGGAALRDDVNGLVRASVFDPIGSDFNLIGDGTGLTGISHNDANGNQVGAADAPIDPRLGPLQNNGGPTLTHALLTGSPAVDRGLAPGAPLTDQRGVGRFGVPDIGAYELPPPLGVNQVVKVTGRISVAKGKQVLMATGRIRQKVTLTNISAERIQGPISLVLDKLTAGVRLWKPAGKTRVWQPLGSFYLNGLPADGILDPGERLSFVVEFVVAPGVGFSPVAYKVRVLAGKGPR